MTYPTAESTRQRPGESDRHHAARTYSPCSRGVHVCGGDHDENRVFTVLNISARTDYEARAIWESARAEIETTFDEGDLVVDLNLGDGCAQDFYTSRQMLPRLERAAILALQSPPAKVKE